MLCQCAEKAPKWTFGGGKGHELNATMHDEKVTAFTAITHDMSPKKYKKEPAFTFGVLRPDSVTLRPGPDYCPRTSTSTPRYGFGSTKRPSPFPGEPGPGPGFQLPERKDGPKFSMRGKRDKADKAEPGPADYDVSRSGSHALAPRWGRSAKSERRKRSASVGAPGPAYFKSSMMHDGPAYSLGAQRKEHFEEDRRQLGKPYTYFGYDDFGHTEHGDAQHREKFPPIRCR